MTEVERSQPRRARHLIDPRTLAPGAPRPAPGATAAAQRSLTNVQRWVMSALVVTTVLHLAVGLAIAGYVVPDSQPSGQVGLNVIAAAFGVLGIAAARAIHAKPSASPWLLLGLLPGLGGLAAVLLSR